MTSLFTGAASRIDEIVGATLARELANAAPQRIVIKPNWVMHELEPAWPIAAMVTDARLIDAVIRACIDRFPAASIVVGDCPELRASWPLMRRQSGLDVVIDRLQREQPDRVAFRDLRKDVFREIDARLIRDTEVEHGDPAGYREVQLRSTSHLEPLADQAASLSIHDHDVTVTRQFHQRGDHRYLVCQTVLDADLVINLPKWKAHSKSGVTGALKNLVGINGDKSYLPHFRRGSPKWGGDEYVDDGRWLSWLQNNLHLMVKGTFALDLLRPAWRIVKSIENARRRRDTTRTIPADFYVVGGSWYGNQTLWRMVFDLNLVTQCVDRHGELQPSPQRDYLCIVDGLIAGCGDGPLKAKPVPADMLVCGTDPFSIDAALCWCMGFDPDAVPIVAKRHHYLGPAWGDFDWRTMVVELDGRPQPLVDTGIDLAFDPPPGWLGHVERNRHPRSAA